MIQTRTGVLSLEISAPYLFNSLGIIILEYTKTTDETTIELPTALTAALTQASYKTASQSAAAVTLDTGSKTEEV